MDAELTGTEDLQALQCAADQHSVRKGARLGGTMSIVIGILNTLIGYLGMQYNPLNAILFLIGIFMILEGLYALIKPSPRLFLLDAGVLVAVGVWNIATSALNSTHAHWTTIGVFQLLWAYTSYKRYQRFSHVLSLNVPAEDLARVEAIAKAIQKGKIKDDSRLITFVGASDALGGGLSRRNETWRGRMENDVIVLLNTSTKELLFVRKADFDIQPQQGFFGKSIIPGRKGAQFVIRHLRRQDASSGVAGHVWTTDERVLKGTVPQQSLDRFEQWKMGAL
jgi:hypothetical protein